MKMVKLNQLCEINIGKTPSRGEPSYWGNGVKWISISDLKERYITETKEQITQEAIDKCNMKIIPSNTVIMSFKLTIGKVAITEEESFSNEAIVNFPILDSTKLIPEYLYYALQTLDFKGLTDRAVMGVTLNKVKLNELKIPLIDLNKQYRIVKLLNKAQELIDKRKEQIEACDELIKGLFYDMFGDIVKNKRGWSKDKVGNKFEVKTGATPSRTESAFWEGGNIPWVKTTELKENVILKVEECITQYAYENSSVSLFPKGTILVAMYGQGKTRGMTAKLGIEATSNQACAAILPNTSCNQDFIWVQLKLSYDELRSLGRGGNQPNLNLDLVRNFEVILPPIELQNDFAQQVEKIEQQKQLMQQSLTELENNFNSLMQRAFKGELF